MSEYRQQMTKSQRDWADGLAQIIQSSVDYPISGDYDDEFKAFTPMMNQTKVKESMEQHMMIYRYHPIERTAPQISKHIRNYPNKRVGFLSTDVTLYKDNEKRGYFYKKDVEDDHIIPIELLTKKMILEFELGICKAKKSGNVKEGGDIFYKQNLEDGNVVLTVSRGENRQTIKGISDKKLRELSDWRKKQIKKYQSENKDIYSHAANREYYDRLMETYNYFKNCQHYAEANIKLYSPHDTIIMEMVKKKGELTNETLEPRYDLYPALGNFIVNEKGKTKVKQVKDTPITQKNKQKIDKLWGAWK